ncbi:P protein isoform X2 [Spodoptera frugiperda]|uniref:P protein isoform X2 n=1 Tax=Spodoptera frugiperda TaxID=7108 RepID=A0A9R0DIS8_SPOFR|nr:P protein isoform X2 [Spodoptera frugiperda]XP_035455993.2 P protein isoform X2 [Spodoptera frugiperda]XP_050558064.1 P protein isoform X3 [Spodoptera frugiperda]XP_050558065.1 P protein isoform X2 [Spodoptera frugiperda]
MDKIVKSVKSWRHPRPAEELSRSQYSLVSTDLTDGAVQLWLGLPDEVKYDPALEQFRQHYEKEHGGNGNGVPRKSKNGSTKRLPLVNSAPHLNNNLQLPRDEVVFLNTTSKCPSIDEKKEKILEEVPEPKKPTKTARAGHLVKMTMLVACWMFFTIVFLLYNEKEEVTRHSSVAPGEIKSYPLHTAQDLLSISLKLTGPFLSEQSEKKLNASQMMNMGKMDVWVEGVATALKNEVNRSPHWTIMLDPEDEIDFTEGETRTTVLKMDANPGPNASYFLKMKTNVNTTTPFALSYTMDPLDISTGVIYACVLLGALYVLIIFEVINRTMAAVLISTTSLAALSIAGERPTLPELISWLDVETLLLLFSMMLLVAIMAETGLFDFLAVFTFEVTKGKIWPLITLLSAITAIISTFLDNVTTVLLMTPVTIRLCEVMDLDPIPVLMSMVLFSNIGGTVTPVGDPPNVIIASNKAVIQSGINFTNFTLHMTFGILLVCVQTYFQFRYIYRDTDKLRLNEPRDIQDLRHQISIWRRAADSLPHLSRDELVVRERLDRKVRKLTGRLEALVKETKIRACPKECFETMLADMKDKYKIRDKVLLVKCTVAITFVVTVFFLHSLPEFNRVSLGWTALLGALLLLTLADREDLEPVLHRIEWSTLLFFAALFVLMEALSKLGLIEYIGGLTESVILKVDGNARLAVAILLMLWVSGLTSAFVDNIPLTTMMVRVVTSLGNNPTLNLPMAPLIWALSFGACLGGNGTLIGASANVVCAGVAEQHGYRFTFLQFFKIGFPIMIGHLIVASGYLMLCHCVFQWH